MIDSLLQPFHHFGVNLGLERIEHLLEDLGNPHRRVPIIHVAGTNGKGSVCAYISSVLTAAGYRVGRYTSPHLVDWTERISINDRAIESEELAKIIVQIQQAINPNYESPTQFEVITAAAWLYFAQSQVDIAVMEVGLGGRLDATNVCNDPLVSIIVSISREHWQVLGSTVADIAKEKAGILKPNCAAVIGKLPPDAEKVVRSRTQELNCPTVWIEAAKAIEPKQTDSANSMTRWAKYADIEYPLPLLGDIQLINSAIAIASLQILQQKGWYIPLSAIQAGMAKTRWMGRMQWLIWNDRSILIDGAHNPAAAIALRQYVDTLAKPITWIMGMLLTKDHEEVFRALLRPGDRLYLVPVPDHSSAEPSHLASLANRICSDLDDCQTFPELFIGLKKVFESNNDDRIIILCGSLYLLGYFLQFQNSI